MAIRANMYQVFTEDVNRDAIHIILDELGIDSYTFISGIGFYKGHKEDSLCILIVGVEPIVIKALCKTINLVNRQECCMVIETAANSISFVE